jgi:hypothetical protein
MLFVQNSIILQRMTIDISINKGRYVSRSKILAIENSFTAMFIDCYFGGSNFLILREENKLLNS